MLSKKIIYFGPNIEGSTTKKRINSLKDLKFNVNTVDSCDYYRLRSSIFNALQIRIGLGPIYKNVLFKVLEEIDFFKPDYLIIETAFLFNTETLTKIKRASPKLKLLIGDSLTSIPVPSMKTRHSTEDRTHAGVKSHCDRHGRADRSRRRDVGVRTI